ncbi:hypothetical protein [Rothia nasisuis]|uniref:hypothetical protein n=1 Tax=Rothia nasisuis TaxID=2109647 RepID=UPI001F4350EF|nr:hypothetical protein [Rothia nasisuis]
MPLRTVAPSRRRVFAPHKAVSALFLSAALVFSACTAQDTNSVEASNVLQNVSVDLTSSAEVSKISSTVVSFDSASGASSSEENTYSLRDAVNELPVRVTTRYTTDSSSGNDLRDLEGYSGDVSIDITVENLTVQPQTLTYDVAGTQKSKSVLVGAPLSVAASTTLTGIKPQNIISEATVGGGSTNGIVSTNSDGDSVLQWGKILAGPGNSSTATFTVNLKAEDLAVPEFAIAVHPGLSNDLTASGAVTSSFSNDQNSTMQLMQQTVDVVTEANEALADAASTVADVRQNLNSTSESLKSSTIQELQQSSGQLTGQLQDLQEKLANLRTNLDESAQGSQEELIAQMQQTVDSLENFLGRQGEEVPAPVIDSQTCNFNVAQPANGSTVYSNMVQLSSVFSAYSEANIDCRDQVLTVINTMLGPDNPTAETCQGDTAGSSSCSIFASKAILDSNLVMYTQETQKQLEDLAPGTLSQVKSDYEAANAALETLQKHVEALPATNPAEPSPSSTTPSATPTASPAPSTSARPQPLPTEAIAQNLDDIDQNVQSSQENLAALESLFNDIHATAKKAIAEVNGSGSMLQQNQELADQLCALADGTNPQSGKISASEADRLRSYLTDTPCPVAAEAPDAATASPSSSPSPTAVNRIGGGANVVAAPEGYSAPMDQRLNNQVALWNEVLNASDTASQDSETAQKIADLKAANSDVLTKTSDMREILGQEQEQAEEATPSASATGSPRPSLPAPSATAASGEVEAVKEALPELTTSFESLNTSLNALDAQQVALDEALQKIIDTLPAENADEINSILDTQVRNISNQRSSSEQAITDLFAQQVSNLTGAADTLSHGADALVQEQGAQLNEAAQRQAEQASARTQSALERIQASHDTATQDVTSASTILTGELEKIMLDIGDTSVTGSGLLGSLQNNAGNAGNADYQLSLATQNAEKYAVMREEDMGAIRLKQAQYSASLQKLSSMPAFKLSAPSGSTVKTIYTFTIGVEE